MRIKILILSLVLMLSVCGCGARQQEPSAADFRLYYCAREDGADTLRWSPAEPGMSMDLDDLLQSCFSMLNDRYSASPMSRLSYRFTEENGVLTVYPNDKYALLSDSERVLANACISLTLLQLDTVQSVHIYFNGNENVYREDSILLKDDSPGMQEAAVSLYFAYGGSRLSKETAYLACSDPDRLPSLAMQALLIGPSDQKHYSMIPSKTQLLDLSVEDGVCTVVLSNDFAEADDSALHAALAVRSITATLCALDGIDAVTIQMPDGSGLQHISIGEPLRAEPQWIR